MGFMTIKCSNCGAIIDMSSGNIKVCGFCGNPIVYSQGNVDPLLIQNIKTLIEPICLSDELSSEYQNCAVYASNFEKTDYYHRYPFLITLPAIFSAIVPAIIAILLRNIIKIPGILIMISSGIILAGIVLLAKIIKYNSSIYQYIVNLMQSQDLKKELEYFEEIKINNDADMIPEYCRNRIAMKYILHLLESGRANTLADALNKYDKHLNDERLRRAEEEKRRADLKMRQDQIDAEKWRNQQEIKIKNKQVENERSRIINEQREIERREKSEANAAKQREADRLQREADRIAKKEMAESVGKGAAVLGVAAVVASIIFKR